MQSGEQRAADRIIREVTENVRREGGSMTYPYNSGSSTRPTCHW